MQLLLILAVLAVVVVSERVPQQPVSGAVGRLAISCTAIGVVALLAVLASAITARRLRADFSRHRLLLRRFRRLRQIHGALWLLCAGGIVYGLGWGQLVRFNWHLDHVVLVKELLILAPVLLPLVLSWAAFYEVDRAVQVGLAQAGGNQEALPTRAEYVALHVRHYLGLILVPLLGLLAVQDALELVTPGEVRQSCETTVLLLSLAALFVVFPVFLRYLWATQPLPPGPLRTCLEDIAGRAGFSAREILVWQTNGMVVNAAVAGLIRRLRYVFLTDALLRRLGDEEIEAIFGHEVGHVRHHHLLLRALAMTAPLSLWLVLGEAFPEAVGRLVEWSDGRALAPGSFGLGVPSGLVLLSLMAAYVVVVFGYFSRQLEHQADLFACRCMAPEAQRPAIETFTSALEKLASTSGLDRHARSWQHASIARRIDFLHKLSGDPKRELRFQRRVRLLGSLLIGTVLSPLAYQLLLG